MITAITSAGSQPIFGQGIGMGSNVGAMLLSGSRTFLLSEGEWGRTIEELGAILGLAVIFARVGVAFSILRSSYKKLATGDLLPWLLASFGFLTVAQAQWAQPTSLGFSTLLGGLMLASLKTPLIKSQVKRKA
jgi:hypothetical protein